MVDLNAQHDRAIPTCFSFIKPELLKVNCEILKSRACDKSAVMRALDAVPEV